jgi:hypothetical protein
MRLIKSRLLLLLSRVLHRLGVRHPQVVPVGVLVASELLLVLRRVELGLVVGVLVMLP